MRSSFLQSFQNALDRIIALLPDILAALVLVVLGVVVGWLVKRGVVRLGTFIKLHRIYPKLFAKGDVRHTFLSIIGSIFGFIIFLVFFDNALLVLRLLVLEEMVKSLAFFIPKLFIAIIIYAVGLFVANRISIQTEHLLSAGGFEYGYVLSRLVKAFIMVFVVALALLRLDISREIVLYGFLIVYASLGLGFVLAFGLGSKEAFKKLWDIFLKQKG